MMKQQELLLPLKQSEYEDLGEFGLEDAQDFKIQQESEEAMLTDVEVDFTAKESLIISYRPSTSFAPDKPKNQFKRSDCP